MGFRLIIDLAIPRRIDTTESSDPIVVVYVDANVSVGAICGVRISGAIDVREGRN